MNKVGKIILFIFLGIVGLLAITFTYFMIEFPKVGDAPELKVDITEARLERGKYLFHNVSLCVDCHSPRDWSKFSAPPDESKIGIGNNEDFLESTIGLPGDFYAANLTPHHLKDWSDGELFRAITSGVSKDGRPLFPIMPYMNYGQMSKEDIYSIIAYIRTLPELKSETPEPKPKFPMQFIMKLMPKEATFSDIPPKTDNVAYGKYMITAAACSDCHTPLTKGQPVLDSAFSGGREFPIPTGGTVASANISPDKNTGIGTWTKEQFISRFKSYADSGFVFKDIDKNEFNTIMPWKKYAGMNDEDLGAIYDYLMSIKPINKRVTRFVPSVATK